MNLRQLTDEQKQLIIELHKSAEGKKKFADVLKNSVRKQLDQKSIPRQFLSIKKLQEGELPQLSKQRDDKFYFINDEIEADCAINTDRLVIPTIETSMHATIGMSILRSIGAAAIDNLDVIIFKEINRQELNLFLKLLKAYYQDCDDELSLPVDVKDFKLILSSNGQNLNDITKHIHNTDSKLIVTDFLEAGEYFAIKDLSGVMMLGVEDCLPADDPSMTAIGYAYFQSLSMACKFEGVKLIDQEIWDNTHIDKFKFMMNN